MLQRSQGEQADERVRAVGPQRVQGDSSRALLRLDLTLLCCLHSEAPDFCCSPSRCCRGLPRALIPLSCWLWLVTRALGDRRCTIG